MSKISTPSKATLDKWSIALYGAEQNNEMIAQYKKIEQMAKDATGEGTGRCCICGKKYIQYGNNPAPYKDKGRCCHLCNHKYVIPHRMWLAYDMDAKIAEYNAKKLEELRKEF